MRGIAAAGYPWNNQADEAVLMEQLKVCFWSRRRLFG